MTRFWKSARGRILLAGAAFAVAALAGWHFSTRSPEPPPRRVYDEAGILHRSDILKYENYLKWINAESDVDIRLVMLKDLDGVPIEKAAVDWMGRLGAGADGREERGVLILYDKAGRRLRVEVGYGLEEYLPDAFVGYLMDDHARIFFNAGTPGDGLHLMLRILQNRIRHAVLGDRFDPTVLTAMRRKGPLSGGAGASATVAYRAGSADYYRSTYRQENRARYVPQDTPQGTYLRYLEWMTGERFDPTVELFTPETRRVLTNFPMTKAYFYYILLGEYGKRYKVDIRGDLALLYFTDTPFVSPHFFRRRGDRWYMDIKTEIQNTVERTGGVYSWDYRGVDDDFTRAFSNKLLNIEGWVRIVGGDNRQLPTRSSRSASFDTEGWTKLHFAAAQGRTDEVGRILDGGERVDVRNAKGRTPLYEAAKRGRLDVVGRLIAGGAAVNATESVAGFTPLHVASERKHGDVVQCLITRGAAVNARNSNGQTPLWQASWQAWHQDTEIAQVLLDHGADPNAADIQGFTPLHMAAGGGHLPLAVLLLQKGAQVDSRTAAGSTPLHSAVEGNHADIVRLLLDRRADVNAVFGNLTPLRIAINQRYDTIAALLREHGAKE